MIRINLIPAEEVQRSAGKRQEMAVGALVIVCAVIGLIIAHGWQQFSIMSVGRQQTRLEREIAELKGPYEAVVKMEREKLDLEEKLAVIRNLEAKKLGPVRMLADLSGATPDKLWLTDFVETGGSLKLSGLGVDEQTVADFLRRLAESHYFQNVDLEETSQVQADGVKHKRFVIKAKINYAAPAAGERTAARPSGDARVAHADAAKGAER
jgi:type IV pilus assembly protein PilN